MSTIFEETTTTVRRKGGLDTVKEDTGDLAREDDKFSGNRRSRQIAKRHWLRRQAKGWCPTGGVGSGGTWNHATKKTPARKEEAIR